MWNNPDYPEEIEPFFRKGTLIRINPKYLEKIPSWHKNEGPALPPEIRYCYRIYSIKGQCIGTHWGSGGLSCEDELYEDYIQIIELEGFPNLWFDARLFEQYWSFEEFWQKNRLKLRDKTSWLQRKLQKKLELLGLVLKTICEINKEVVRRMQELVKTLRENWKEKGA